MPFLQNRLSLQQRSSGRMIALCLFQSVRQSAWNLERKELQKEWTKKKTGQNAAMEWEYRMNWIQHVTKVSMFTRF